MAAADPRTPPSHASLRIASADVLYVHLPAELDTIEMMKARLRALDQGRRQFRKRVVKKPKPKPIERFTPIVSDRVVDAFESVDGFDNCL